jgi:hypothetical protein
MKELRRLRIMTFRPLWVTQQDLDTKKPEVGRGRKRRYNSLTY